MASLSAVCKPFLEQMVQGILTTLNHFTEWQTPMESIQVDDIVCLWDEPTSPTKWPLARVMDVYPGLDGKV